MSEPTKEFSPESAWVMMSDVLATPITNGYVKAGFTVVCLLAMSALSIAMYFYNRDKREKEAIETEKKVSQETAALFERAQLDADKARINNLTPAYKDDYNQYVKAINKNDYGFLGTSKIPGKCLEEISKIVYNGSITPEIRASRIIGIIEKTLI
jgi:hypothetical protein